MDPRLQPLHDAYAQTMSPNADLIKQAEAFLKSAAEQPQYGILLLQVWGTLCLIKSSASPSVMGPKSAFN